MSVCPACEKAKANPLSPFVKAGCVGCGIRELARSPLYHQASMLESWRGADYRKALAALAGDRWREMHALVKAERERQKAAAAA